MGVLTKGGLRAHPQFSWESFQVNNKKENLVKNLSASVSLLWLLIKMMSSMENKNP